MDAACPSRDLCSCPPLPFIQRARPPHSGRWRVEGGCQAGSLGIPDGGLALVTCKGLVVNRLSNGLVHFAQGWSLVHSSFPSTSTATPMHAHLRPCTAAPARVCCLPRHLGCPDRALPGGGPRRTRAWGGQCSHGQQAGSARLPSAAAGRWVAWVSFPRGGMQGPLLRWVQGMGCGDVCGELCGPRGS